MMNIRAKTKKTPPKRGVFNQIKQAITPTAGSLRGFGQARQKSPAPPTKSAPQKSPPLRNTNSPPLRLGKSPPKQRQAPPSKNPPSSRNSSGIRDKKFITSSKVEGKDGSIVHNIVNVPEKEIVVNDDHMDQTVKNAQDESQKP